jgi:hypothetical protein
MAFAVALGGMIMNWSIDRRSDSDCELVNVQVTKFCSTESGIDLALSNGKESVALKEIKVSFIQGGFENTLRIKDSKLTPGQSLGEIMIPASIAQGTAVSLIGVIGNDANPITCTTPIKRADPITAC